MIKLLAGPNIVVAVLVAWLAWGVGHRAPIEVSFKDLNNAGDLPPSGNGYLTLGPGGIISSGNNGMLQLCGPDALMKLTGDITLENMEFHGGSP
jgi:hypothetical protein